MSADDRSISPTEEETTPNPGSTGEMGDEGFESATDIPDLSSERQRGSPFEGQNSSQSSDDVPAPILAEHGNSVDHDIASVSSPSTPAPVKSSTSTTATRTLADDTRHIVTEAKDVIEYEWPPKSGDKWFIQEQIGELLDIKSFSRKYTDFTRRKVEKEERDFLFANYDITNLMTETQIRDLCAVRSIEIHDLMSSEYPIVYQEYQRILADRYKAVLAEQAREMQAIKNDAKRMAELRAAAIKSAAEFNKELQAIRRQERGGFWDVQTNIVQMRRNMFKTLPPEKTKVDKYPVHVMTGQFQNFYKRFTREELNRLPVSTVMDHQSLFGGEYREPSPPRIAIAESKPFGNGTEKRPNGNGDREKLDSPAPKKSKRRPTYEEDDEDEIPEKGKCQTCGEGPAFGQKLLQCGSCKMQCHPECIDMSDEMISVVFTYPWNCIDCKRCTTCNDIHSEENIIFCDRCDRGFHTFCVGLDETPTGQWMCDPCVKEISRRENTRTRSARRPTVV